MAIRLLLIDAFNLIRRIYEAQHGDFEAVCDASSRSIQRALREHDPSHACVVFDSHDTTWRHLLDPAYKANRGPTPAVLLDNLAGFEAAFRAVGVSSLKLANYEADDLIATLASGAAAGGAGVQILSTDRVFLQLTSDKISVFNHFESSEYKLTGILERYGVGPGCLTDLWAMAGDSSNNIKGVPGVGEKTASALLRRFGSLDAVLASQDSDKAVTRVQSNRAEAERCKQLVSLKTDVELGVNLKSLRYQL